MGKIVDIIFILNNLFLKLYIHNDNDENNNSLPSTQASTRDLMWTHIFGYLMEQVINFIFYLNSALVIVNFCFK